MSRGTRAPLLERLEALRPGSVRDRPIDRAVYAHDASHYLMSPTAVVTVQDRDHLAAVLRAAATAGADVAFRSGGTSLSGQASSTGLLLDTRRGFRRIEVLDGGDRVRVQPGATVRQVNAHLARHGRKLGPDPASEAACTLGGVIANNSSGMACGIADNAYRTIESAVLVLADGTVIDTAAPDADERLRREAPALWQGLARLRDDLRADPAAVAEIRRQYAIKNTMGYGLNAFLDHDDPTDVLLHLVVGSEGTLAFVAEATLRTVPQLPHVATGMLYFGSLEHATAALPALVDSGLATIELLDATSLRVAQREPDADADLRSLEVAGHAALLVEYQEATASDLAGRLDAWTALSAALPLVHPAELTDDAERRAALWHIRKNLYATVAGDRPSGTTALLEDVAVPVPALRETCERLIEMFDRHGYRDSVIFGHAKDGNIHFMLTERFDDPASLRRSAEFTEELVELVLSHGGTLKAEHGTGRIMAPFVRRQFGDRLYEAMVEVKRLCDPQGILGVGVLIDEDPDAPLRHLKVAPRIDDIADRCVECGYCEPVCPSKDVALTPRQRIVLRRERETARLAGDLQRVADLDRDYRYDGVDMCAADGMCQTACPVQIDTGALMKRLRAERGSSPTTAGWTAAARHWGAVTRTGGVALSVAKALPAPLVSAASDVARAVLGADAVPHYDRDLPRGGTPRAPRTVADPAAVYLPSCIGSMFAPEAQGVRAALLAVCERAGVALRIPDGVDDMCCGTPWSSKGDPAGHRTMADRVLPALREATDGGRLPVISDGVSCTEGLVHMAADAGMTVIDAVPFVVREVLPALAVRRRLDSVVVHPTCSAVHLGTVDDLVALARAVGDDVVVPTAWGCCGFAGDRGMLHPELTASATSAEAAEVGQRVFSAYASANRTCEIGMSRATGRPYRHILELLDDATRP